MGVQRQMQDSCHKFTARGYALTIKGFLKNGMVDASFRQMEDMHVQQFYVPPFATTQLFRASCESGRSIEILDMVEKAGMTLSPDAVVVIVEDCGKRSDVSSAKRVEHLCRKHSVQLLSGAYDGLLKLYTLAGDTHALDLFKEMQASGTRITEGLCVGLIARCAETKFLRFADEITMYVRAQSKMTIALYSARMKVYAYCGMFDKACGLYDEIINDGLEPDSMMYGCLMKFSVECGRTDLSQAMFDKAPCLEIQNYMSLIRAAGLDGDLDRAFWVLQKLRESDVVPDIAAYNCVLDVCVSVGDMVRVRTLMAEMRTVNALDVITYNTLLKGYCNIGDFKAAKNVLKEMVDDELKPNDVSYNCLVNCAVTAGHLSEAWDIIAQMETAGVAIDHFTLSIMMKALKKVKNYKDLDMIFALVDRTKLNVCSDEVLLNTLLETCVRYQQSSRLEAIIGQVKTCSLRPSVHTYGSLIKAYSSLKRIDGCWELWSEMVDYRAMVPNEITIGCMLDALVCNRQVEQAVALLQRWKDTVPPNIVMYSTIIKGFANTRQASRAMDVWEEMKARGVKMNTVVYNALIDAQARVGSMDTVSRCMEAMEADGCVPDMITYSTIVKGYCVKGDMNNALEVFRCMQKNNMAINSIIYNTILDGCARHRMDLAEELLEDMATNNIAPSNFTLGILVKMYGRNRLLRKAFEVVELFPKKHGFVINAQVRTSLMCACINNGALDRAYDIFGDLQRISGADATAYGVLISGTVRHGNVAKAVELVEDAYGLVNGKRGLPQGQSLSNEHMESLLRALNTQNLSETLGVPLLDKLRAAKIVINSRLISSTVKT